MTLKIIVNDEFYYTKSKYFEKGNEYKTKILIQTLGIFK